MYEQAPRLTPGELLRTFGSLTLGSARLGFGLVVLVSWVAVTGRTGEILALTPRQWGWALLTGVILAGFVAGRYAALARAKAVDVTAVLVFAAVITAALSGAFKDVVSGWSGGLGSRAHRAGDGGGGRGRGATPGPDS